VFKVLAEHLKLLSGGRGEYAALKKRHDARVSFRYVIKPFAHGGALLPTAEGLMLPMESHVVTVVHSGPR
jgi:hypothetical protein